MNSQVIKRELSKFLNLEDNMYKDTYLLRRISARARRLGVNNLMDYYLFLKKNKNELEQLLLTITINTTEFFRDPIVWKTFQNKLLPEIIRYKQMNNLKGDPNLECSLFFRSRALFNCHEYT